MRRATIFRPELVQPEVITLLVDRGWEVEQAGSYAQLATGLVPPLDSELVLWPTADRFLPAYFDRLPNLRVLASATTTSQHIGVLSPAQAADKRWQLVTLKDVDRSVLASVTPTAEHTLTLISLVTRNIQRALRRVDNGYWNRSPLPGAKMLSQSSLWIAGRGRIANMVYERARSLFYSVEMAEPGLLHGLLERGLECDVLSLHIPPTEQPFISHELLANAKIGYLINTSQGNSIDEWAVIRALDEGRLRGYAADCLAHEYEADFRLDRNPLWQRRDSANIVLTPHIGGSTLDAWRITQLAVVEKALELLDAEALPKS